MFTWGFGGYGRLGHAEPKDEMVPRHLKFFDGPNRGATQIYAGSTFTLATNEYGKYLECRLFISGFIIKCKKIFLNDQMTIGIDLIGKARQPYITVKFIKCIYFRCY